MFSFGTHKEKTKEISTHTESVRQTKIASWIPEHHVKTTEAAFVCTDSLFAGVYLPLLWESSFCWKSPIALGYTRGHFSALVALEVDTDENVGAGANIESDGTDVQLVYLPLTDSEGKPLPVHFLTASEVTLP